MFCVFWQRTAFRVRTIKADSVHLRLNWEPGKEKEKDEQHL
jgi:hypothetical protein